MITVEKQDNRILLWAPWTPDADLFEERKRRCKLVDGNRWVKTQKAWSYPLEWSTCLELRQVWGAELLIGPQLTAWATAEKQRRAELADIAKQSSFDLVRVQREAPELAEAMMQRTYQQVGAAFLARLKHGLLGDQPGLGKTLQAMAAVIESGVEGVILVVAPATAVRGTWLPEIEKWLPGDAVWACTGTRAHRIRVIQQCLFARPESGRRWLIINPEMLEVGHDITKKKVVVGHRDIYYHDLDAFSFAHIIVDESHRMLITRTAKVKDQPYVRQGLGALQVVEGGLRLAMSGTPMRGKQVNLWGTLNWLQPQRYTSFWRWVEKWFECWDDPVQGDRVIGDLKPHREQEFHRELDSVMLRRTKAEVVPDLPPKLYAGRRLKNQTNGAAGIWLPMTLEQKRCYAEIRRDAAATLDGGTLMANGVLAELTRLRQFAVCAAKLDENGDLRPTLLSNKFEWLVAWLAERGIERDGEGESKVIVASQFSQVLDLFSAELNKLGIDTLMITGVVSGARREAAKTSFQSDGGPRVMLLTTTAGGVSLTLDAADDVIFLDETWIPDDQEQVEDRSHRVSRMHQVTIWYVRSLGTVEHQIATANIEADDLQKTLLDGRRGVSIARQLLDDPKEK
jgi:SNF2 family DNA or RNA helicase